jgi:hypothetical protein
LLVREPPGAARIAGVKIYGLDFTSAPKGRKPLVAIACTLEERVLRVEGVEVLDDFEGFEGFLESGGPWVCGMDFPFGQPRPLIEALGWPSSWEGYVGKVSRLSQEEFEDAVKGHMAGRPKGGKFHYRLADRRSGSSSAMMLFRVPVGKMFYRGAPRLLASGVSIKPCRPTDRGCVAVEAYPAVVARRFLGRESYKSDDRKKQTPAQRTAREKLLEGLGSQTLEEAYGFTVEIDAAWREELARDPMADTLDSVLCAVQAAWAYTKRGERWGVPEECDRDEGWIMDPQLLVKGG